MQRSNTTCAIVSDSTQNNKETIDKEMSNNYDPKSVTNIEKKNIQKQILQNLKTCQNTSAVYSASNKHTSRSAMYIFTKNSTKFPAS